MRKLENYMKTKYEDFEVSVPDLDGTGFAEKLTVKVPLEWDEELQQWLLTPKANQIIEDTKARHMGLLLPSQFRELRERLSYSQKQMGELFHIGAKSWTRWESGKLRPSRSINLLVRALYEGNLSMNYLLKRNGKNGGKSEARKARHNGIGLPHRGITKISRSPGNSGRTQRTRRLAKTKAGTVATAKSGGR